MDLVPSGHGFGPVAARRSPGDQSPWIGEYFSCRLFSEESSNQRSRVPHEDIPGDRSVVRGKFGHGVKVGCGIDFIAAHRLRQEQAKQSCAVQLLKQGGRDPARRFNLVRRSVDGRTELADTFYRIAGNSGRDIDWTNLPRR